VLQQGQSFRHGNQSALQLYKHDKLLHVEIKQTFVKMDSNSMADGYDVKSAEKSLDPLPN
jgi:hypothetical protein